MEVYKLKYFREIIPSIFLDFFFFFFFFFGEIALGFELRASCLLGNALPLESLCWPSACFSGSGPGQSTVSLDLNFSFIYLFF
jgi:hypothetical protein